MINDYFLVHQRRLLNFRLIWKEKCDWIYTFYCCWQNVFLENMFLCIHQWFLFIRTGTVRSIRMFYGSFYIISFSKLDSWSDNLMNRISFWWDSVKIWKTMLTNRWVSQHCLFIHSNISISFSFNSFISWDSVLCPINSVICFRFQFFFIWHY